MSSSDNGMNAQFNEGKLVVTYTCHEVDGCPSQTIRFLGLRRFEWVTDHYTEAEDIGAYDAIIESSCEDKDVKVYLLWFDDKGALRVWASSFEII